MEKITLTEVDPTPDIGRCEVCREVYATKILTCTYEHRFCDKCFEKFKTVVNGGKDETVAIGNT